MQQNGTIDINLTLMAWADIVIEKFKMNIQELDVIDEGYLYESLLQTLLVNAGQDIERIDFSFKLYGIYVDMGVGKETQKGNSGDLGFQKKRKAKEWFSRKYYGQVMKLREILLDRYSKAIAYSLMNTISESLDQRYKDKLEASTVVNLRSVRYRATTNARTAENYAKRRAQPGRWTNDHKTWKPD